MTSDYQIPVYIIVVEFFLVALIVIATYMLKIINLLTTKISLKYRQKIEKHLKERIIYNNVLDLYDFPEKWKNLEVILSVLQKFDLEFKENENWLKMRSVIINTIILPLGRIAASSSKWKNRFYAIESFMLMPDSGNEPHIIKLINDEISIIYFYAIQAAVLHQSRKAINAVITRVSKETWQTQSFYVQAFNNASLAVKPYIEERLHNSDNKKIRSICLYILTKFPPDSFSWDVSKDIESCYLPLKFAAIRFITHSDREKAIPLLSKCLDDVNWQIKTVSLNMLAKIKAKEVIPYISKLLNDPEWSVRLAAAQTLNIFGKKGQDILHSQDIEINPVAYHVAQHVLTQND